jgi:leader peptidase (prepilin peptidase)/N-methyltransferase
LTSKSAEHSRANPHRGDFRGIPIFPPFLLHVPLYLWFPLVFIIGAMVGSFLNVCIYRLPKEKSPFWPMGSRCGRCFQPIAWYDNVPLLSYWLLRGRCRTCGAAFSIRYFCIELFTALAFVGLFYLEVVVNVHGLNVAILGGLNFQIGLLTIFVLHAVLVCFLLVATFCDIDGRTIPLSLTITGSIVGVIAGVLWPWPWPYGPAWQFPAPLGFRPLVAGPFAGPVPVGLLAPVEALQPWPPWMPLPSWLPPLGWQTGLVNSLVGILVGTLMIRAIRLIFGIGMGRDYMDEPDPDHEPTNAIARAWNWLNRIGGKTLGLGDADLMMMAGAFLGWQPVVAAFFIGVFPGMLFGLGQMFYTAENRLPFGPALSIGIVITMLCWGGVGPNFMPIFFNPTLVAIVLAVSTVFMVIAGYVLRVMRMMRGDGGEEKKDEEEKK